MFLTSPVAFLVIFSLLEDAFPNKVPLSFKGRGGGGAGRV